MCHNHDGKNFSNFKNEVIKILNVMSLIEERMEIRYVDTVKRVDFSGYRSNDSSRGVSSNNNDNNCFTLYKEQRRSVEL